MPKNLPQIKAIQEVYNIHGPMGIAHLAYLCHEEGVWSNEEWTHMAFDAAKRQVVRALKEKRANGLPYAVPTRKREGKGRIWKQMNWLEYDEAQDYLRYLIQGVNKDVEQIELVHAYMLDRWNRAPDIPVWRFPEEANPHWLYEDPEDDGPLDDEDDD